MDQNVKPETYLEKNVKSFRELSIKPYRIIFKIENDSVYIVGVFDGRLDFEVILIDRLIR